MFWKNFYELCMVNNLKPLQVVNQLHIAAGSITNWKNGTIPSAKNLKKLADFFKVSVEYFFIDHSESNSETEKEPEPRERIFFSYAKESEVFDRLLEPIIKDPTPIQTAYDKASPEIQAAVRKLLDL